MSEYDNSQINQQPIQQPVQPMQQAPQYVQTGFVQQGDPVLCSELKKIMASNMAFAAAIMTAVSIFCLILAGIVDNMVGAMIALSVPFIIGAVECWVTFGTARWGKSGIKTGGMITGKVFSIIYIVFTGFVILFYFICAVAWSVFASIVGEFLDEFMREILGFGDVYGDIAALGNSIVLAWFFLSMIPLVLNIVMQAMLNRFRNRLIEASEDKLVKRPKTMGLAVIMFLVGLPLLAAALLLLWTGFSAGFSTVLIGIAYTVGAAMYFYGGVIVIKCGKGR